MPIGECLQFGWDTWKRHIGAFVIVGVALFAASALAEVVAAAALRRFAPAIGMLVGGLFWGGMTVAARKAARGAEPTLADAFAPFTDRPGDYILVGFVISLGAVACGIGAVATSFLFLFAPLCVAEGGDWKQSLTHSKDLMLANVSETIVFYLVLLAINAVGFLACVIGLLVTLPVTTLAIVKAYELTAKPAVLPVVGDTPAAPGQ